MRKIIVFIVLLYSMIMVGQTAKTISLDYSLSDFNISEDKGLCYISSSKYEYSFLPDTTVPALPYIGIYILVDANAEYNSHSINSREECIKHNAIMVSNPHVGTTNSLVSTSKMIKYDNVIYPQSAVNYENSFVIGSHKVLAFSVCPFRYDAINKQLYLKKNIALTIMLSQTDKIIEQVANDPMEKYVEGLIVNKSDLKLLSKKSNFSVQHKSSLDNNLYDYDYLIITKNSLKSEFQRLADWKTIKGIRTKVLSVESIIDNNQDPTLTLQQKIKQAISDYYVNSQHKLQYVLLGGDDGNVPTELCHVECSTTNNGYIISETACDLYYSSLKNIIWDSNDNGLSGDLNDHIDFSPDIIVTRLSASNCNEVKSQVDRIINYEACPDTTNWTDNILLCGTKTGYRYYYPDGYMSDTHYKAETFLYHGCIEPYWQNGTRYMLYDTDSSFGGAGYDYSVSHLHDQLEQGYTFVNVDTHGCWNGWKVEYKFETPQYFYDIDANTINNTGSTIITTTACHTNDFTETQPCLSEVFMRNPNSGVLGYYGSSKEGFYRPDSISEGSSMKYNRKMYEILFNSTHHQLGRSVYESKMTFLSQCSNYDSMRWLMFSLNALCDPEMPVFLSKPKVFDNVQITMTGNTLSVNTGISDCRICVMSRDDNGESYYDVEESISAKAYSLDNATYTVCITKTGYVPYVAVVGTPVYIQNEDIGYDLHIISGQTYIGNNVTFDKPTGNVCVSKGKTSIQNSGTVSIPSGFEVNLGAMFEIDN